MFWRPLWRSAPAKELNTGFRVLIGRFQAVQVNDRRRIEDGTRARLRRKRDFPDNRRTCC
jgi:hypothetical protein